jgi:replicative DNA helicase
MKDREYLEQVLIGKIINDKKIYYDNHSLLSEDLFTNSQHKKLYRVIDESLQKSGKCDMTDFYNKSKDKYEAIELARVCTERSYDPYLPDKLILVLLENNKMSELERLIVHVNRKIQDKDDLFEIISYTEEQLQKIGNVNNDKLVHISEQMPHMVKSIEKNVNNQGMTGIPSGFETIDRFTSGWQKQDLVIIGGASSMGKTSFALNMSVNAVKRGFKSVIFSYEMSVNQMLMRIVSGDSEINVEIQH